MKTYQAWKEGDREEDAATVVAQSHAEAAAFFAEDFDARAAETTFKNGGFVCVRELGGALAFRFEIECEAVLNYYARGRGPRE
jgi:hypothetical protein